MATSWLGNLSQLFTALGLGSLARQAANLVGITGGNIDGTVIGATTPAAVTMTTGSATGTFDVNGSVNLCQTYNAAAIPGLGQGLTVGWNYTQGNGEVDFFSNYTGATTNFNFYRKASSTVVNLVASLGVGGAILPYGATITGTLGGSFTLASEPAITVTYPGPSPGTGAGPAGLLSRMLALTTGGGTISVTSNNIAWTARFAVMNLGVNAQFSTNGYFDITMPANGTVIPGYAGVSNQTVAGGVIAMAAWQTLYYIAPIGAANTVQPGNFAIVGYTTATAFVVPAHWIPICQVNGDNSLYYFLGGKYVLANGDSVNTNLARTTYFPNASANVFQTSVTSPAGIWSPNNQVVTGQQLMTAEAPQTVTYAATTTINWALGFNAAITLTGNVTFAAPSNGVPGQTYVLTITQDSTGSRTASWATAFDFGAAGTPTLTTTAGKTDILFLYCVSATQYYVMLSKGF